MGALLEWLPFVDIESSNLTYRTRLLDVAFEAIWKSPWFGGLDIYTAAGTESLRQHYGTFIDVVNTYVAIMLTSGLVGLTLFVSFFAAIGLALHKATQRIASDDERRDLGRALAATLVGVLVMIFTVSSITVIPTVYWCLAGMAVGYAHALATHVREAQRVSTATSARGTGRFGGRLRGGSA
jgi:O-antigen ligase